MASACDQAKELSVIFRAKPTQMKNQLILLCVMLSLLFQPSCKRAWEKEPTDETPIETISYMEEYRPQFHFSPPEKWMNDPNGLVFHQGVYHLFYQFYPEDIVWGPMHWGHAVSKDMRHWENKPIALYPDEHGLIFSGSAVVDEQNTSGFGSEDNPPLVAVFTYHDMEGEKAGTDTFQTQGIAYSLDNGESWTKYEGNPVIGNEGIRDFRDPKVFWDMLSESWIMVLVAGDHAKFYRSADLKDWDLISEFGRDEGAHGGVWECPDLFALSDPETGKEKWVLLISINPGAPNGGSGTQYFIGDWDGTTFSTDQEDAKWLDWGTDNYAGVTYNNVPNGDRIFIGWMSNWAYARDTPTEMWRSAMTVPRKLALKAAGEEIVLTNYPLPVFDQEAEVEPKNISLAAGERVSVASDDLNQSDIRIQMEKTDMRIVFNNPNGDELLLELDTASNTLKLDRTRSGITDFQEDFGKNVHQMPVPDLPEQFELRILLDWSSIEVFLNDGQYVMTDQVFPSEHFNLMIVENMSDSPSSLTLLGPEKVNRIW